jgi:hypothetical protein
MHALRSTVALLLLVAAPVRAAELDLGWTTNMIWDSNPLREPDDEEPDFSFYGGPNLSVRKRTRSLDLALDYLLRYEQYVDHSSVNGFEHFANGRAFWEIGPRSSLSLTNNFSRTRGLGVDFIEPVAGIAPVGAEGELQFRRSPTLRNFTTATYDYQLSKLWSFESSLGGQLYDYEDELRSDVRVLRGSGQFVRLMSQRLLLGFGGAFTRQQFEDTPRTLERGSSIAEAYGVSRYQISPTLSLSLSGGPAWNQPDDLGGESRAPREGVRSDQTGVSRLINPANCRILVQGTVPAGTRSIASCPTAPGIYVTDQGVEFLQSALIPGVAIDPNRIQFDTVDILGDSTDPDSSFTFFGRAALTKVWRTVQGEISYRRSASASSGLGSTDLDVASAVLTWKPDRRRWRIDARATWTRQSSANDVPGTDLLLSPVGATVYVDSEGVVHDQPVPGAVAVPNAARVVGVRTLGSSSSDFEIDTLLFDLIAERRMSNNLVLNAQAGWWRQESTSGTSSAGETSDATIDDIRFRVGFTWSFDRIEF